MQSYKLNFLFLLSFFPVIIFGQDPYFVNFDTKDGLPSSEVHAVEIDSNGILWFATDRGVCSYDGYEFTTFTTEDGLASNSILAIWKDRKGNFWFPGLDGSLSIYDHEKIYPYQWNKSLQDTIHRPGKIAWDMEDNLYFWRFGYNYGVIYSIKNKTGKVRKVSFQELKDKFSILKMNDIQFIDMNGYYLPDDQGLYSGPAVIKTNSSTYYNLKLNSYDRLGEILFKYSNRTKLTESYNFDSDIISFNIEKDGTLSVCTKKGLYRFKDGDINSIPDRYFEELKISDITSDLEGNHWITTLQNGVFKVPSFHFKTIRTSFNAYSSEKILSIAALKNHMIFGSSDGNLYKVDKDFKFKEIEEANIIEEYWFASNTEDRAYFRGLQITEVKNRLSLKKIDFSSLPGYYQLKSGNLFCLGYFEVRIISPESKILFAPPEHRFKKRISTVHENQDKIWMGTAEGLFSVENYIYENIINESSEDSLLQARINDLKTDTYGNLWVSTIGSGIIYKTPDTIFQISTNDGLKSNFVNHSFVENDSSIWIATSKGLNNVIYTFENDRMIQKKITSFTTAEGLLSNYINSVTKWKGQIWIATNKGINYFSPDDLEYSLPRPTITLENVTVNSDSIDIKSSSNFLYNQNDFYFRFTGISFKKSADQDFYRYRLMSEGNDPTWFYTNNRDVRFNDLQAGNYTFEAAAQNKFGQWSEQPIVYNFTIRPHFTQTIWFRGLSLIAIIATIVFFFQTRTKRIQRNEEQKRKIQEAELQALRNQMNPHFVFNALNSIQNFVFKNDAKKANYYLSRFSKLMRDGLQFARLKYISLQEEIIFLNTYLELEKMRFPDKFKYRVIVDEDISTNQYFIPPLLFQPILENAVKHAFKNIDYEGLLEIHFEEKIPGELLKITIKDNGEGFNLESVNKTTKSKNKSLGLEIIKNQIALLNSEGKDSKASFRIFNRNSLDTQLTGTQAEFIISIKFSEDD